MSFTRSGGTPPSWYLANPIQTGISSNYTAQPYDYYIGVNGQNVTVTLPTGATQGKVYVIKDESGKAGKFVSWRVTVAATSPDLIDGQASAILALNYGSISLLWTGSSWSIF